MYSVRVHVRVCGLSECAFRCFLCQCFYVLVSRPAWARIGYYLLRAAILLPPEGDKRGQPYGHRASRAGGDVWAAGWP